MAEALFGVCIPQVAQMQSRLGALAVLGNHDHWLDAAAARRPLAEAGIGLVENRHRVLARMAPAGGGGRGRPLGRGAGPGCRIRRAPPADQAPRILLSHNPDYAANRAVAGHGARLMLCGHTHGGRVTLPGLGVPILPIRHREFARGLVNTAWGQVYISRGIGQTSPPVRVLTWPEIASLRLRIGS